MLKVQELEIDGNTYRLREPRIRDYLNGQEKSGVEASCAMLGGMLLDKNGDTIGEQAALDLPLVAFNKLAAALAVMMNVEADAPLPEPNGSSSA